MARERGKRPLRWALRCGQAGAASAFFSCNFSRGGPCGELAQLALLPGLTVWRGQEGMRFVEQMTEKERAETLQNQNELLARAVSLAEAGACELLALDEVLDACQEGLLDESLLRRIILRKPAALELVITGHKPAEWVLDRADYITEMIKRRHPYDRGVAARRGIEF